MSENKFPPRSVMIQAGIPEATVDKLFEAASEDDFCVPEYIRKTKELTKRIEDAGVDLSDVKVFYPQIVQVQVDRLADMFRRQEEFMQMLKDADKLPEWPIDITSKFGQRQLKEINGELVGELYEAMYILKNRAHRFTDHKDVDFGHFKEELGDAFAYFMELCLMSGISADELYEEYCRKNALVKKRAQEGY